MVLPAVLTALVALVPAGGAAAAPSVPRCALGAATPELRGFYPDALEAAERRFGGSPAARRAFATGVAAYVYGLAPVSVYQTVQRFPGNQIVNIGALTTPDVRTVVLPNHDTTYTVGRLDLSRGPVVIDVPDTAGRYYVLQLLDAYSNTEAYVGRRTTGTAAGSYAVVPPGYQGGLPAGVRRIESSTNQVWVLGRTLVQSEAELPVVAELMRGFRVTGLVDWTLGTRQPSLLLPAFPATPRTPIPRGLDYFDLLGDVLATDPPPPGDRCALRAFARARIGPGRRPSGRALEAAIPAARRIIARAERLTNARSRRANNGWFVGGRWVGDYGRRWLGRAVIARTALGANTPAETVYPLALTDSRGRALSGARRYTLRFERGELPPVDAFWSITMYGADRYLVDNAIGRYSIGDRTPGLVPGRDGSLTIHIQRNEPGSAAARANWLPAPAGRFRLAMRLYEPRRSVLDGRWLPPPLRRR